MTPLDRTRLEKAAADCGFDLTPVMVADALVLRSTQFPESVSIEAVAGAVFDLTVSAPVLLDGLHTAANGTATLNGYAALYAALEQIASLARTMPNRVADKFNEATAGLPRATEAERLVVQRVGQDLFRGALLDYWQGRCCVTGLAVAELLRASHIKPWSSCETDEERLDVFNGLLLSPNFDALFDGGWITFDDDRRIVVSDHLAKSAVELLGLQPGIATSRLGAGHMRYMMFHRTVVFRH
jgi:putative restriction endonuclease